MDISIFLAKAIGLYYLIVGVGLLVNKSRFRLLLNDVMNNGALLFVTGFPTVILGVLLVVSHNIWVMDWRVVITIIGWLVLIKGTLLITYPQNLVGMSKKWMENDFYYYLTVIFVFFMGIFLICHGAL